MALFWLLPFSPLIAIVALAATYRSTGRVRQIAVVGAILSAGFTLALGVLVFCLSPSTGFVP